MSIVCKYQAISIRPSAVYINYTDQKIVVNQNFMTLADVGTKYFKFKVGSLDYPLSTIEGKQTVKLIITACADQTLTSPVLQAVVYTILISEPEV